MSWGQSWSRLHTHTPLCAVPSSLLCCCSVRVVLGYAGVLFWVALFSAAVGVYDITLVRVSEAQICLGCHASKSCTSPDALRE